MKEKKERLTLTESFNIISKALKISIKTKTTASQIVSLLGFPLAFLPMLISLSIKNFSNQMQALYGAGNLLNSSVLRIFLLLSALYITQLIFNSIRNYFANIDRLRIKRYIKERILRCTCDVKYKYIENYDNFKEQIQFAETEAGNRVVASIQTIIVWLQNIVTFVSIVVVMVSVNAWIVIVLCIVCIPAALLSYNQKDEEYRLKTFYVHESLMALNYFMEATRQNSINEVRFFGIFNFLKKKFQEMNTLFIKKKNKITRKHVIYNSIADILRNSVYIIILLITASRIFEDPTIGIGAFMLVFTLSGQLLDVTSKILITTTQFFNDIAYMKDYFHLDKLEYEKRDPNATPREQFAIDFMDVNFAYPNTDRTVLHNINLHIREGEKVAIVGENGSGKTTFINLLCGMYEPDRGKITMGGEDIHSELSRTRRTISAVFQDFSRYETSIRENITISNSKKVASDQELRTLTEETGAWEFIESQPAQLDEIVGTFSETGNNLSGGQWQKIAITRCAYREDAKIMVLDEPTAALDPLAEADLYRNFSKLTGDRTTILISHRLGIANLVDRILVFDDGRIVEDGNHLQLMKRNGLYAKMYKAQAQWYE